MDRVDRLISISNEKKSYLDQMFQLSKKQEAIIKNDDLSELDSILNDRDSLMKKIDRLDLEFLEIYKDILASEKVENIYDIDVDKFTNIKDLKKVVGTIRDILKEIDILDKNNMSNINKAFEEVQSNLKQIKTGQKLYKGYNMEVDNSILIDSKK